MLDQVPFLFPISVAVDANNIAFQQLFVEYLFRCGIQQILNARQFGRRVAMVKIHDEGVENVSAVGAWDGLHLLDKFTPPGASFSANLVRDLQVVVLVVAVVLLTVDAHAVFAIPAVKLALVEIICVLVHFALTTDHDDVLFAFGMNTVDAYKDHVNNESGPAAYKDANAIRTAIGPTVEVVEEIRPILNLKAE
jgi:hypothetical protein